MCDLLQSVSEAMKRPCVLLLPYALPLTHEPHQAERQYLRLGSVSGFKGFN